MPKASRAYVTITRSPPRRLAMFLARTRAADTIFSALVLATALAGCELEPKGVANTEQNGVRLEESEASPSVETIEQQVDGEQAAGPSAPEAEVGRTFVFDCGGDATFTIRTGPAEVAFWAPASLGGAYHVLSATPAASGARYQEGDTVFWSRGDLATIEHLGQRYVDCRSNPGKVPWADAARRGAMFRALGNEPSWNLEVYEERLVMVTELGTKRTEMVYDAPELDGARTTYLSATDEQTLRAVIERRTCSDSMSGEVFEATATVTFEDRLFYGCGRFLR